jgi:hypothetical protein
MNGTKAKDEFQNWFAIGKDSAKFKFVQNTCSFQRSESFATSQNSTFPNKLLNNESESCEMTTREMVHYHCNLPVNYSSCDTSGKLQRLNGSQVVSHENKPFKIVHPYASYTDSVDEKMNKRVYYSDPTDRFDPNMGQFSMLHPNQCSNQSDYP